MSKKIIGAIAIVLGFLILYWGINLIYVNPVTSKIGVFEGVITNMQVNAGNLRGEAVYDKNCINIGKGMTKCDAGIETNEYGLLNFNYVHDMKNNPCIEKGDKVTIKIINSNGSAIVKKIK